MDDLNQRLARAAQQKRRLEKLERQSHEMENECRDALTEAEHLKRQAEKEAHDVTALEGLSLTGLFYSLLGTKDERLVRERQEAVAAELKQAEAASRAEALQRELQGVRAEVENLAAGSAQYETLLREKEVQIERSTTPGARELFRLTEQTEAIAWQIQQVDEAVAAGHRADATLAKVEDSLSSASNWGTWDMIGGGLVATAVKHSRVDDARAEIHRAQQDLATFRRELKDISSGLHVADVDIDGFTTFADYFFDNLITDWVVQNRINDSLASVTENRRQIAHLLQMLAQQRKQAVTDLETAQADRAHFIEQFQG